jgi:hypothetical protein
VKVFFDTEFTGLRPDTTLMSIGMVSDDGKEFYAELTDYDENQVDSWIQDNVVSNFLFPMAKPFVNHVGSITFVKGDSWELQRQLTAWLSQFKTVKLWSDCCHYDMVLFQGIFGGAFHVPDHVLYIPFDICTVMEMYGIDPDISREAFIDTPIDGIKHNALYDAKVIQACYDKLHRNKYKYPNVI